jgi:hypothetical protein
MTPKEKYINYIVDDLVKNTKIDHIDGIVYFPFSSYTSLPTEFSDGYFIWRLRNHIEEKYGAHKDEMLLIEKLYVKRMKTLIKK